MVPTDFNLLFLEDDPDRRARLLDAAAQAGLQGRVRCLPNADEALAHFRRGIQPSRAFKSIFLFNLGSPSSLDVLRWLKEQPALRRLITIGLFEKGDGKFIDAAYQHRVNSCLERPRTASEQVQLFDHLRKYWAGLNIQPEP